MKVVIFERDYADEFDTYGFATFTEEEYQKFLENIDKADYPAEYGFGTNEAHEFQDAEDYKSSMRVVDITEEEHKILRKIFDPYPEQVFRNTIGAGIFPMIGE
jgi:hypothetical protein